MVNRVWQWHFGEGLMRTPNNWGKMGDTPANPELLDYLAKKFVESGWSVKSLHRMILLSNTYQMSAQAANQAHRTATPPTASTRAPTGFVCRWKRFATACWRWLEPWTPPWAAQ